MGTTAGWTKSPFGDLPSLRPDDTPVHQTWLILAGGIALILSRASESELESRFAAAREVYAVARARLHKRRLPKPDPRLLRDALNEIANLTDPMTREAGRECLERSVERLAAKAQLAFGAAAAGAAGAAASGLSTSHAQSTQAASTQTASTQISSGSPPEEHEETRIDLDLLFERTKKLRETVAWARTTTFGQD